MGDVRDETDKQIALKKIFENGFLYLIPVVLQLDHNNGYILLDLEPNSVTILKFGEVLHSVNALTPITRKLLLILSDHKFKTKEELIKEIWGYEYNPLVHDPIIYNHLSRLRKMFGAYRSILSISERGYQLSDNFIVKNDINLIQLHKNESFENTPIFSNESVPILLKPHQNNKSNLLNLNSDDLNHRQIQILKWLQVNDFIDIQRHQKLFKVSPITATRDLSTLQKIGFLKRVGKARATKYCMLN